MFKPIKIFPAQVPHAQATCSVGKVKITQHSSHLRVLTNPLSADCLSILRTKLPLVAKESAYRDPEATLSRIIIRKVPWLEAKLNNLKTVSVNNETLPADLIKLGNLLSDVVQGIVTNVLPQAEKFGSTQVMRTYYSHLRSAYQLAEKAFDLSTKVYSGGAVVDDVDLVRAALKITIITLDWQLDDVRGGSLGVLNDLVENARRNIFSYNLLNKDPSRWIALSETALDLSFALQAETQTFDLAKIGGNYEDLLKQVAACRQSIISGKTTFSGHIVMPALNYMLDRINHKLELVGDLERLVEDGKIRRYVSPLPGVYIDLTSGGEDLPAENIDVPPTPPREPSKIPTLPSFHPGVVTKNFLAYYKT